ncbi:hypothetical protein A6V39_01920 [Candidatus Mycoplasma haematobovis]|uniref:Uncharacterized protein n=1 Tax=Candidatus Mycoplasma haematobovis TaxID=432608 RepID=A0A1A9QCJ5_9MOLU|nr:hypothetical protein [Candidatus Mycoplasma haematobovis]OAL10187.1 hypothetical protein A6V39_01920 [Candidatus Mycoplasma haematobovis]
MHSKIKKIADEMLLKAFKATTGSSDFAPVSEIFLKHWFESEVWITYDEEILNMELKSINSLENSHIENTIPESKFRLFQKEEGDTWKSLITGIGGYKIDGKKHLLICLSFKDYQIF